jgi:hypothetical protein
MRLRDATGVKSGDTVGLKVVELNQQWEQLWFPQQVAA